MSRHSSSHRGQHGRTLVLRLLFIAVLLVPFAAAAKKQPLADPKTGKVRDIRPVARGDFRFQIIEPTESRTKVERFFPYLDVSGVVTARSGKAVAMDIMFALDKSSSVTAMEGGVVREPEGFLGLPEGARLNIYQAQIKACLAFIKRLSRSPAFEGGDLVRVGLVTLAGPDPSSKLDLISVPFSTTYRPTPGELIPWMLRDSEVALPLTSNLMDARVAFEAQFFDKPEPRSGTDFAAGVTRSLLELVGEAALENKGVVADDGKEGVAKAEGVIRPNSKKVIIFLTDMSPSLPGGNASKGLKVSGWASDLAAEIAGDLGVQIHAFSWGRIQLVFQRKSKSFPLTNLAIKTGGLFTQVENPGELVTRLANVSMSGLHGVEIVNKAAVDSGDFRPVEVQLSPDGSFDARVPMVEDALNEVVVTAQVANGKDMSETLHVDFSRSEEPATAEEKERYDANEQILAELRAHMEDVRKNAGRRVTLGVQMSPAEILEMRDYCAAVEDPMATRVIEAQLERCRRFRREYPSSRETRSR